MKTRKRISDVVIAAIAAIGFAALAAGSASAGPITINNWDFSNPLTGPTHNTQTIDYWNQESGSQTYIDNNDSYKPASDAGPCLYLNAASIAVNQDLSHSWVSSDLYTLGIIGQNPTWDSTGEFKVQLRETDGTVLWDSGALDIDNTVVAGNYSGTGHIFNWVIDASTFGGAGVVEGSQLNLRILCTDATLYADDVTLEVTQGVVLSGKSVPSNAVPGTLVGSLTYPATNDQSGITYTLPVTGTGPDSGSFQITGVTNLRTDVWISTNEYDISVVAWHSGSPLGTNDFTISVSAVADYIAFKVGAGMDPSPDGTEKVGVLAAEDWSSAGLGFDIVSGRDDLFMITGGTNVMQVNGSDPGSTGATNYITVRATNGVSTSYLIIEATVSSAGGTVFMFM